MKSNTEKTHTHIRVTNIGMETPQHKQREIAHTHARSLSLHQKHKVKAHTQTHTRAFRPIRLCLSFSDLLGTFTNTVLKETFFLVKTFKVNDEKNIIILYMYVQYS